MALVLAIDTCGGDGTVQLFDTITKQTVAQATLPGRETQEKLMPAIGQVLSASSLQPNQLAALAVVTGPGSFTGVRIGMAAVKGLAEALDLPIVALSRLVVLSSAVAATSSQGKVHAWLDAGRGDLYAGILHPRTGEAEPFSESLLNRHTAIARVGPEDLVAVIEPEVATIVPNAERVSTEAFLQAFRRLVLQAVQRGDFADTALLDANYLRVPDAELAMQARRAAEVLSGAPR